MPFLFIKGGFSNIKQLWNNFRGFSGSSSTDVGGIADTISSLGPTQWTTNATLETLVYWLTQGISAICGGGEFKLASINIEQSDPLWTPALCGNLAMH